MYKALILVYCCFSFNVFAQISNINHWDSEYEVVECLECASHVVDSRANTKNFISFGIGLRALDLENRFECANSELDFSFYIDITSDDGKIISGPMHLAGQCSWGELQHLEFSKSKLNYFVTNYSRTKSHKINLTQTDENLYLLEYSRSDSHSNWGYPEKLEYKAVLKKVE